MKRAKSVTPFRRENGTYTLDMWIPRASPDGRTSKPQLVQHEVRRADPNAMQIDAVSQGHCVVPLAEWNEFQRYQASKSVSTFHRPV